MKNANTSDKVMKSVREEITQYPFQVTDPDLQVKIISGKDEGIGLWITANYISGSLGNVSG